MSNKTKSVPSSPKIGMLETVIRMNEVHSNRMRGKLFNLIDSTFSDPVQRESFKGLVRDFTGEAHYALNRDIMDLFRDKKVEEGAIAPQVSLLHDEPREAHVPGRLTP